MATSPYTFPFPAAATYPAPAAGFSPVPAYSPIPSHHHPLPPPSPSAPCPYSSYPSAAAYPPLLFPGGYYAPDFSPSQFGFEAPAMVSICSPPAFPCATTFGFPSVSASASTPSTESTFPIPTSPAQPYGHDPYWAPPAPFSSGAPLVASHPPPVPVDTQPPDPMFFQATAPSQVHTYSPDLRSSLPTDLCSPTPWLLDTVPASPNPEHSPASRLHLDRAPVPPTDHALLKLRDSEIDAVQHHATVPSAASYVAQQVFGEMPRPNFGHGKPANKGITASPPSVGFGITSTPTAPGASTGPAVLGTTTAAPLVGNTTTSTAATTSPTTTPSAEAQVPAEASISKNMPRAILDLRRRLDAQQARDRSSFDSLRGELAKLTSMASQLAVSLGMEPIAPHGSTPEQLQHTPMVPAAPAHVASQMFTEMPTTSTSQGTHGSTPDYGFGNHIPIRSTGLLDGNSSSNAFVQVFSGNPELQINEIKQHDSHHAPKCFSQPTFSPERCIVGVFCLTDEQNTANELCGKHVKPQQIDNQQSNMLMTEVERKLQWDPGDTKFSNLFTATTGATELQCTAVYKFRLLHMQALQFGAKREPNFDSAIWCSYALGLARTKVNGSALFVLVVPGSAGTSCPSPSFENMAKLLWDPGILHYMALNGCNSALQDNSFILQMAAHLSEYGSVLHANCSTLQRGDHLTEDNSLSSLYCKSVLKTSYVRDPGVKILLCSLLTILTGWSATDKQFPCINITAIAAEPTQSVGSTLLLQFLFTERKDLGTLTPVVILIPEQGSSWFNAMHYCRMFQKWLIHFQPP